MINPVLDYSNGKNISFHTPGHKGNKDFFKNFSLSLDVTELCCTDDIYKPYNDGYIEMLEDALSDIFTDGAMNTVISCGGATLLIQASVLFLSRNSKKSEKQYMLCDRNSHISLVNALMLCNVEPIWFWDTPIISDEKNIIGIFVTSPDYYGNIKKISILNLPLIIDNSHGSHLAFYDDRSLYNLNATICINSLHKTLPVMTGGAVAHFNKSYTKDSFRSCVRIFASTSPSFLIQQSIHNLALLKDKLISLHLELLDEINRVRILFSDFLLENDDPFRLVLNDKNAERLFYFLCDNGIFPEFFDSNNVILISSIANTKSDFDALICALKKYNFEKCDKSISIYFESKKEIALCETLSLSRKKLQVADAINLISANAVAKYPPGVPIVMPGEIITEEIAKAIGLSEFIEVIEY